MMKLHEDRRYEIAWYECDICGAMTDDYHPDDLPSRPRQCPDGTYCTEAGNVSAAYIIGCLLALLPGTLVAFVLASLAGAASGVA